jgi:uncharacterized protein YdeI (YjbR/CyaY-like superfamily)
MYEPKNAKDLADFLKSNKEKFHEIWIVLVKKEFANPQPVSFSEAVSIAVEQGLIDSKTKSIDEKRYAVRFTKRKNKVN